MRARHHADCKLRTLSLGLYPDGAFAALAAHLYFSAASLPPLFFPNTVYNPLRSSFLLHLPSTVLLKLCTNTKLHFLILLFLSERTSFPCIKLTTFIFWILWGRLDLLRTYLLKLTGVFDVPCPILYGCFFCF